MTLWGISSAPSDAYPRGMGLRCATELQRTARRPHPRRLEGANPKDGAAGGRRFSRAEAKCGGMVIVFGRVALQMHGP